MNFKQKLAAVAATAGTFVLSAPAFAAGPTAGDLTNLTPDAATILTAIGAVAVVMLGVQLAIVGYRKVKSIAK